MNYFKDLVWYKKILLILVWTILSPILLVVSIMALVIFFIVIIVPSPFEMIKYKRSPYYQNTKRKYNFAITRSESYELYNYLFSISKHEKIDFSKDQFISDDENIYIWFYYDEIWYDEKSNIWMTSMHEGAKATELETFTKDMVEKVTADNSYKKMNFLVQEDIFTADEFDLVSTDSRFLVYKDIKDLAHKLV